MVVHNYDVPICIMRMIDWVLASLGLNAWFMGL